MILPNFNDLHILVLGDVMIDRYQYGIVKRISPEAPIPVVELNSTEDRLGGAANVALNLVSLGAKVTIIGLSGNDDESVNLEHVLNKYGQINYRLIKDENRKTTVKTRILAQNQHLLRIDHESTHDISLDISTEILDEISSILKGNKIDGIILQDYNKGYLTENLISHVMNISKAEEIPTFVDPKLKNFFAYKGCTIFKPNKKEILEACKSLDTSIFHDAKNLLESCEAAMRDKINNKISFVTLGSEGIYTATEDEKAYHPTDARNIADVCGAGDTVLSILTLCYLKDLPLGEIAKICNIGGGQVCEKPGVVQIDRPSLEEELVEK